MGKLTRAGDPDEIGEALVEVLREPDRYRRPRAFIEQCFSFKETVDRYEQFFRQYARH
jgi:hypothetical protein